MTTLGNQIFTILYIITFYPVDLQNSISTDYSFWLPGYALPGNIDLLVFDNPFFEREDEWWYAVGAIEFEFEGDCARNSYVISPSEEGVTSNSVPTYESEEGLPCAGDLYIWMEQLNRGETTPITKVSAILESSIVCGNGSDACSESGTQLNIEMRQL